MRKQVIAVILAMAFFVNCKADYSEFENGLKNLHQEFYDVYNLDHEPSVQVQNVIQYFNTDSFRENLEGIYSNLGYISADILIEIELSSFGIASQELLVVFLLKILTYNLTFLYEETSIYSYLTLVYLRRFCNSIEKCYSLVPKDWEKDYGKLDELLENAKQDFALISNN